MGRKWLTAIGIVAILAATGWFFRKPCLDLWETASAMAAVRSRPKPRPDPTHYGVLKDELEHWRIQLAMRYQKAGSAKERTAVEQDARIILEQMLPPMMRCWLGTPWDFQGTAEGPGNGRIACGYFVSTVLKDAGFKVNRYRLAQQPSGNILQTFLSPQDCTLTIGKNYETFATDLNASEPGIYLVGLDTHVAFLVVSEGGFHFIHSSGSRPWCVVAQTRTEAQVLKRSNWRMIGNLTASPQVIRLWLKGDKIPVKGS